MIQSSKLANECVNKHHFQWSLRVYYEDTDAGGIVYYANYLKYFERARTEWLRHHGLNQQAMADELQVMFVVKSAKMDYHFPARLDDELTITISIENFGRASVVFVQEIWCGSRCLVSGSFKVGCVHSQTVRPCALPASVTKAMQTHGLS